VSEQQPVAWRYRYPNDPTWQITPDEKQARDKTGEVQPLYASPDHIGNSTTMVPALGVEGADKAARAIIAAMEKNDG